MDKEVTMPVGIVIERREVDNPWIDYSWRPVAVVPGVTEVPDWRELERGEGWTRFLCASLPVTLHRKETEGYQANLADGAPVIYIVLRESEDDEDSREIFAVSATASPYDAQDFLDSGEDIVEAVAMPPEMAAWLSDFVAEHHVGVAFKKRKRVEHREEEQRFGKRLHPIEQRFYDRGKLN
jgi:hypothetical protein